MPAIKEESNTYLLYPDIEQASTVRDLISDILQVSDSDRLTAAQLLAKYGDWLSS